MTFWSALILGLLSSFHCAGMCGGLQAAIQQITTIRTRAEAIWHLLALNMGRLLTYIVIGVLLATFGSTALYKADISWLTRGARIMAAVTLILLGVYMLLSQQKPFAVLEKLTQPLWAKLSPLLNNNHNRLLVSLQQGLIWGFLPCGLVYAVWLTTLFANTPTQAAQTMLGFGLGTLPSMLLTGVAFIRFKQLVANRAVQIVGGLVFIAGGLLMLTAPWWVDKSFLQAYPQLISTMFCL